MIIKNGNVFFEDGTKKIIDIQIDNGIIANISESITPEENEEVFDAGGMNVLPGFVQPISIWGVNGSMMEIRPSSEDNNEKSDPITPELSGFYAFNGRAATAQQLGAFGLTTVGVAPADTNLFGGTIAAFDVDGVNPYKMLVGKELGMMASVSKGIKDTYSARVAPQTRMWIYNQFAELLRKASEYKEDDKTKDPKLAAVKKVVDGDLPLFVSCDTGYAARHVWDIVSQYNNIKLVLVNGFDLNGDEDWIIENQIPVIVRTAPYPLDEFAMRLNLKGIKKLQEAGVPVAVSGQYSNAFLAREDMLWNGAEMMRVYHDDTKVLPMLTSVPAKLLNIDDKVGSIAVGKHANIIIWSDNPLTTYQAKIVRTYQNGTVIYKEGDEMKCM